MVSWVGLQCVIVVFPDLILNCSFENPQHMFWLRNDKGGWLLMMRSYLEAHARIQKVLPDGVQLCQRFYFFLFFFSL